MTARVVFFGTPEFAVPPLAALVDAGFPSARRHPARPPGRRPPSAAPSAVGAWRARAGSPVEKPRAVRGNAALADARGRAAGRDRRRRVRPDPAARDPAAAARSAASTCTPRCCRATAAPRRSRRRSLPATPRPAWTRCGWRRGSTPGPSISSGACRSASGKRRASSPRGWPRSAASCSSRRCAASRRDRFRAPQEGEASSCRPIRREDGAADWTRAAAELVRRLRAFTPWPGL